MPQSRQCLLLIFGIAAWSSTAANSVLSILEATSFSISHVSLVPVAATASTFNLMSLCCLGIYIFQHVKRKESPQRTSLIAKVIEGFTIFISITALALSLALLILTKSRWDHRTIHSSKGLHLSWNAVIIAQITAWVITCISQILLFGYALWQSIYLQSQQTAVPDPRDSVMSEIKVSQPGRHSHLLERNRPSLSPGSAVTSPTLTASSPPSLRSFRDSLRYAVRPVTSRTTLISRPSLSREARAVDSQSIDNISHSDGFDTWDTRDALVQATTSEGMSLEPIPGSRPDSPARALDGPFDLRLLEHEDFEDLTQLPRMRPDRSRPPSPVVTEGHIHPLFRTETSSPAPEATPGTSIVASPLANQAIAMRPFRQMRSNSRPASPSLLVHQKSFTRDRATSVPSVSRSSSPPSRVMTPPIPDFVLNSSPRSSMSGSRKVNLHYPTDR